MLTSRLAHYSEINGELMTPLFNSTVLRISYMLVGKETDSPLLAFS